LTLGLIEPFETTSTGFLLLFFYTLSFRLKTINVNLNNRSISITLDIAPKRQVLSIVSSPTQIPKKILHQGADGEGCGLGF
jgi:hypothetical protein